MENIDPPRKSLAFGEINLPFVEVDGVDWFLFGGAGNCGEIFGIKDLNNKCKLEAMEILFPQRQGSYYRPLKLDSADKKQGHRDNPLLVSSSALIDLCYRYGKSEEARKFQLELVKRANVGKDAGIAVPAEQREAGDPVEQVEPVEPVEPFEPVEPVEASEFDYRRRLEKELHLIQKDPDLPFSNDFLTGKDHFDDITEIDSLTFSKTMEVVSQKYPVVSDLLSIATTPRDKRSKQDSDAVDRGP